MKGDDLYIKHILDAIGKVELYVSVGRDRFMEESHWHDATVRQLEIIGEATKHLSGKDLPELKRAVRKILEASDE